MTHNFSLFFYDADGENCCIEVPAKSLDDAMIVLYEMHPLATFDRHDVDINPAAYESESDTINKAIAHRSKK